MLVLRNWQKKRGTPENGSMKITTASALGLVIIKKKAIRYEIEHRWL